MDGGRPLGVGFASSAPANTGNKMHANKIGNKRALTPEPRSTRTDRMPDGTSGRSKDRRPALAAVMGAAVSIETGFTSVSSRSHILFPTTCVGATLSAIRVSPWACRANPVYGTSGA